MDRSLAHDETMGLEKREEFVVMLGELICFAKPHLVSCHYEERHDGNLWLLQLQMATNIK